MKKVLSSLLDIKSKKIRAIVLLPVLISVLTSGISMNTAHFENNNIRENFYQSVNYDPVKDLLSFPFCFYHMTMIVP